METVLHSPRHVLMSAEHPLAGESELHFRRSPMRHTPVCTRAFTPLGEGVLADRAPRRGSPPDAGEAGDAGRTLGADPHRRAVDVLPEFMVSPIVGNGVCAIPLVDVAPFEFALAGARTITARRLTALFDTARRLDQEPQGRHAAGARSPAMRSAAPRPARSRTGGPNPRFTCIAFVMAV